MTDCRTRSDFLIRAMRLGIAPDQLIGICTLHSRGLGYGEWETTSIEVQDEVIADLLDRIDTLGRAGLVLVDAVRLQELERKEQTLQHLAEMAIERMHQSY